MQLGPELHKVATGRIFCRGTRVEPDTLGGSTMRGGRDGAMLFGVVEIPMRADVERMHNIRLNTSLWMDIDSAKRVPSSRWGGDYVRECGIGDLLREMKFASFADSTDVFVRATMLKHERPGMRWAYIAGAYAERPRAMPVDGLYEFGGTDGVRLVSDNPYRGEPPSGILRSALWGPGGQFGLATDMEAEHFPKWLEAERTKSAPSDPMFPEFVKRLRERVPELMVYTVEQKATSDAAARSVIQELLSERDGPFASPQPASPRRNRP